MCHGVLCGRQDGEPKCRTLKQKVKLKAAAFISGRIFIKLNLTKKQNTKPQTGKIETKHSETNTSTTETQSMKRIQHNSD